MKIRRSIQDESGKRFDLAVVGGGPGGYAAAIRAAQLGLRTVLVERDRLGGVCANWGCIPTKALLAAAELKRAAERAAEFGVGTGSAAVDLERMVARSRSVADEMAGGVSTLLAKHGVEVLEGAARFTEGARLVVDGDGRTTGIDAAHVILATGARPRALDALPFDGERVWSYREAMLPEKIPNSVLVVGAGAVGIEFASFYSALGTAVTVVEAADRILPGEDADISAAAKRAFEREGIEFFTGAGIAHASSSDDGVSVLLADGAAEARRFDRAIVAVGIEGNVEGLDLENTTVHVDRGHVCVDARSATAHAGIFAIGDLAGPPWLAHKASHEAVVCVESIAGVEGVEALDRERIPACTYSAPQIASVGLTESAARARTDVRVGRFSFAANGKARAVGEPDGFVKTVLDAATGEVLGAHLIGEGVTELVHAFALAMSCEATEAEIMATVFPHPTRSEAIRESVLDAFGKVLHS